MRLFFSVLFHESEFSIKDFSESIKFFYPEATILLSLSQSYSGKIENLSSCDNLMISPQRIYSSYSDGTVWFAHLSNLYNYYSNNEIKKTSSDRVVLCGSNEMFIKSGLELFLKKYKPKGYKPKNNIHFQRCSNSAAVKKFLLRKPIYHHVNEGFWFNPKDHNDKLISDFKDFSKWYTSKEYSYIRRRFKKLFHYSVSPKNWLGNKFSPLKFYIFCSAFEEIYFPSLYSNPSGKGTFCYMDFSKNLKISKNDISIALSNPNVFSIKRVERSEDDEIRHYLKNLRN